MIGRENKGEAFGLSRGISSTSVVPGSTLVCNTVSPDKLIHCAERIWQNIIFTQNVSCPWFHHILPLQLCKMFPRGSGQQFECRDPGTRGGLNEERQLISRRVRIVEARSIPSPCAAPCPRRGRILISALRQ